MSTSPSNGKREFNVGASAFVAQTIRSLQEQASQEGRLDEFNAAFKAIYERLRQSPFELGEPLKDMQTLHLQLRGVAMRPVYVEFAVHTSERAVFIRTVKLLGLPR